MTKDMNAITSGLLPNKNSATTNEKPSSWNTQAPECPQKTSLASILKNISLNKLRGLLSKALLANRSLNKKQTASVRVYDIVNCGPRHRFATAGLIVHNCLALGYSAGWEKFISMALMPMYGCMDLTLDDDKVATAASLDKKFYLDVEKDGLVVPVEYDPAVHGDSEKIRLKRFIVIMGKDGLPIREKVYGINARKIVSEFRKNNPLIASQNPENLGIWQTLDNSLKNSARNREDFIIEMPDGGVMTYRNARSEKRRKIDKETGETYDRWEVRVDISGRSTGTYGGKLTENFCQRFARDVFIEGAIRADEAGHPYVFNVYDEGIHEVDDDGTELGRKLEAPDATTLGQVVKCYAQAPEWAAGLPVGAEGLWSDRYAK